MGAGVVERGERSSGGRGRTTVARRLQGGRRGPRETEEPCRGGGEILARAWSRIRREPPRLTARAWGRGTVCVGRPQAVTETRERALECGR
jgi:hypothetical protein